MGVLIGRLEGEPDKKGIRDMIIEDAVPISHGGAIEVAFAPEDYVTFSMVDAEYAEKGWFSCGWYHSHPGLQVFFSSTDTRNQLGWQTPNPSAVGIVFDHTYLEKPDDLGFRTFRLDDPNKGHTSDYHEVKNVIVEPPDSHEYYLKLMELISSIHSKEPPILEINEMPDIFGDIAFPSENQITAKISGLDASFILSAFKEGIVNFIELSIEPLLTYLNIWSQNMINHIVENNSLIRKDLILIKEKISSGISSLQKDFKFALKEEMNDLDMYIDDIFEGFDNNFEEMENALIKVEKEVNDQLTLLFQERIMTTLSNNLNLINDRVKNITETNDLAHLYLKKLEDNNQNLVHLSEKIKSLESITINKLTELQEEFSGKFSKNSNKIVGNLINLNKDTKSYLSDLKAAIILLESSRPPLEEKMKLLETENKELQQNVKDLKIENQDLSSKIKKLEEEVRNKDE